jgi:hypothetical protein
VPVTPFFFWPGCETLVKKKKNIAYYLCLTQNNSQKALQREKEKESLIFVETVEN